MPETFGMGEKYYNGMWLGLKKRKRKDEPVMLVLEEARRINLKIKELLSSHGTFFLIFIPPISRPIFSRFLELLSLSIYVQMRQSTDLEAVKLWNAQSGIAIMTHVCGQTFAEIRSGHPTSAFTILKLYKPLRDLLELDKIRRSTYFQALKLWKGLSGKLGARFYI